MYSKLNELNIFALRDLARKTGVSSPTSKKKEQLITEIIEIVSGQKSPTDKSKQGRPPKVFDYNFANVFNNGRSNSFEVSSNQTLRQNEVEYENSDIVTVAGWIELVNNNAGILTVNKNFQNENYFVPSSVLVNYNVKTGDRIVAEINIDENQNVVKEIFSVNDCPVSKLSKKRCDYDSIQYVFPNKRLNFFNEKYNSLTLLKGENIYVYGNNNNQNTSTIIDLMNSIEVANKLYVNISVAEKNKCLLKNLQSKENFLVNIMDENDVQKRIVNLAIERAKRIIEIGEDVLLVVDDMASIYGVEKSGLILMKSLVSLAKETKGKGSITLLAVMPNENFNQIEKLADRRLRVENELVFEIN